MTRVPEEHPIPRPPLPLTANPGVLYPLPSTEISAHLFSFSPFGKWRTDDGSHWTGQGGLAGGWNSALSENSQMAERGGKRKPQGIRESWKPVLQGLRDGPRWGSKEPGCRTVLPTGEHAQQPHTAPGASEESLRLSEGETPAPKTLSSPAKLPRPSGSLGQGWARRLVPLTVLTYSESGGQL